MIQCNGICKSYGQEKVLTNFSYLFPETGFVLLYGESGCGKTTLLNILAGFTGFDKGQIIFENETYKTRVDWDKVRGSIGYIPQDTHFIDYLTVLDNLKLCSTDDEYILQVLDRFGLSEKKDSYPGTLSGGEKQRIAIIQALLGGRNILFLDEPTASLDRENKTLIFRTLEELKENKLIICSSHDDEAKLYADKIIDLSNQEISKPVEKIDMKPFDRRIKNEQNKRNLLPFFKKQYKYPGREKKSGIRLTLVFFLAVITLCICDTPQNKTDSNIEYTYHLNQIQISAENIDESLLNKLANNKHVKEVDLAYNKSVPDGIQNEEDINSDANYNMTAETIPFNADAFRLSDDIKYGSYYTKAQQVILSYDKALSLGNPKDLIGQTLKVQLYDKDYDMEIVGVFNRFSKIEKQYLWASGVYLTEGNSDTIFLNGEFTKRYIYDKNFFFHGQRIYTVYFDTFKNMKSFYENNNVYGKGTQFIYAGISSDISGIFIIMFIILFPMVLVVIPVSILLYYQTWKIKMIYNKHVFSVYQYLGYTMKEIKKCWMVTSLEEILKMFITALAFAIPFMWLINLFNSRIVIIPFQIFTYNIYLILLLIFMISLLGVIASNNALNKVKMAGWYQILLEYRDLI